MHKKEKVDYIFFSKQKKPRKRLQWWREEDNGIQRLNIECGDIAVPRLVPAIRRVLKRFCVQDAVVNADTETARLLGITEMLFAAEKEELLRNRGYIIRMLFENACVRRHDTGNRHSFRILLEDERWQRKELMQILLTAKDLFQDLEIVLLREDLLLEGMVETLYREWGIVLHIYSGEQFSQSYTDVSLVLVKKWEEGRYDCNDFGVAYFVPSMAQQMTGKGGGSVHLYSGLEYMSRGRLLPRGFGKHLAVQRPEYYQKNHVSVVAICPIEW